MINFESRDKIYEQGAWSDGVDDITELLSSLGDFISDTTDASEQWAKTLLSTPFMLHNIMIASIQSLGLLQRLNRMQSAMQPLMPFARNATFIAGGTIDTSLHFGNSGNEWVDYVVLQNNFTSTVYYAFDMSSVLAGNEIYALNAGSSIAWNRKFRHLHVSCANQVNIGGQSGLTVGAMIYPVAHNNFGVGLQ